MFDIPEDIVLAVKKGSYELDQRYPQWHEGIHLESLDMASSSSCVLAHVAGWLCLGMEDGYYTMLNEMVDDDSNHGHLMAAAGVSSSRQTEWAIEHGFMEDDSVRFDTSEEYQSRWIMMEEAWKASINERNNE